METTTIEIATRAKSTKGANKLLRRNGYLPGSISCKGKDSISIALKRDEIIKSLRKNGRNAVFKLESADNKAYTVMVKEIQYSGIKNEYLSLEFQQVSLSEEVNTDVAIKLLGVDLLESKRLVLNKQTNSILIKGLPQDIPDAIEIDVSNMKAGDSVLFSDINLPNGLTADIAPEHLIATVSESRVQGPNEVEETE